MLAHTPSLSLNRPSAGFYRAPVQSTTGRYHVKPPKFVNGHWIRPQNNRVACNEATASGGDWKKEKKKEEIAYLEGKEYLKELGMDNDDDIAKILDIAMNPDSMFLRSREKENRNYVPRKLSVDEDLKPVVNYLETMGLTKEQILRVIRMHPPILCYDAEKRIKPLITCLQDAGVSSPVEALVNRPSLFGLDAEEGLSRIIDYLKANEFPQDVIVHLLETSI